MTAAPEAFDAIILGAGAAGLMCALVAGQRGRKVLLLEHTDKAGAKILISGGGRCNFTNLASAPDRFLSGNPHFCTSALRRYTQRDFIELVRRHGIAFHEKTLGQLFCDGSARSYRRHAARRMCGWWRRRAARPDCQRGIAGGALSRRHPIGIIHGSVAGAGDRRPLDPQDGRHGLQLRRGAALRLARHADAAGAGAAEGRAKARPDSMRALAGVAFDAVATFDKQSFRENILFTHRGLSGPAILQISSYWRPGEAISIDLLPGLDARALLIEAKRARPKSAPQTVLAEVMPARLAQALTAAHLPAGEMANISDRALGAFADGLKRWQFLPAGTEGYAKAEVTVGGIDTRELSSKTMEARDVPGLYAIGEAVDVTGWLGGYNFQWAWSSGWSAGQSL